MLHLDLAIHSISRTISEVNSLNEDCVIENSKDERSDFMDIRCIKSKLIKNNDVNYDEKEKSEIVNIMDSDESNQIGKMKVENLSNKFLEVGEVKPELKSAESVSDNVENNNKGLTAFNNYQNFVENKHEASKWSLDSAE
ncbi:13788_t:CDS:2, partial [Racocetra persica]